MQLTWRVVVLVFLMFVSVMIFTLAMLNFGRANIAGVELDGEAILAIAGLFVGAMSTVFTSILNKQVKDQAEEITALKVQSMKVRDGSVRRL